MLILGGGGGRRSKHWPPGAGDPRYATGSTPGNIYIQPSVSLADCALTKCDVWLCVECVSRPRAYMTYEGHNFRLPLESVLLHHAPDTSLPVA